MPLSFTLPICRYISQEPGEKQSLDNVGFAMVFIWTSMCSPVDSMPKKVHKKLGVNAALCITIEKSMEIFLLIYSSIETKEHGIDAKLYQQLFH